MIDIRKVGEVIGASYHKLTQGFIHELMEEWERGGSGDFRSFMSCGLHIKWVEYVRRN